MSLHTMEAPPDAPVSSAQHDLELHGFSYEERQAILPAVTEAIAAGGCWLKERRVIGFAQVEFLFEMQLRAALEVYSALIGAGLELTQGTHAELTGLCTVRRHNHRLKERPGRVLSVRLEVNFMEDTAFELGLTGIGLA